MIRLDDAGDREDLGAFVARVVRMDPQALVRLRNSPSRPPGPDESGNTTPQARLQVWATTPFDALVTRSVAGRIDPPDCTVHAANLLPGIAVARSSDIDPGPVVDSLWRTQLPPLAGWSWVDTVPGAVIGDLIDVGGTSARENVSPAGGTSSSLLDQQVLTVEGAGYTVAVPMRCLFALSGMGFAGTGGAGGDADASDVRVFATDAWLRLDARFGAVVRRRHSLLPLLF
ncbi:MAG: hypothetical protein ABIR83_13610 [Nakamurella sp.]